VLQLAARLCCLDAMSLFYSTDFSKIKISISLQMNKCLIALKEVEMCQQDLKNEIGT